MADVAAEAAGVAGTVEEAARVAGGGKHGTKGKGKGGAKASCKGSRSRARGGPSPR